MSRRRIAEEKRFHIVRSVDLEGGRVSSLKILLTEEGEIDQIFWFWFGKSYIILELVLFYRIESCFAVIG